MRQPRYMNIDCILDDGEMLLSSLLNVIMIFNKVLRESLSFRDTYYIF